MSVRCSHMRAELGDLEQSALGHRQPQPDVLHDRSQADGYGVVMDTVSVSRRAITVCPWCQAELCPKFDGVFVTVPVRQDIHSIVPGRPANAPERAQGTDD